MDYFIDACESRRLSFKPTGNQVQTNGGMMNAYDVVNPVQEYKRKANRKALNAIRKKYKDFIQYGSNMLSIDGKYERALGSYWDNRLVTNGWNLEQAKKNRVNLFAEIDKFIETNNLELAYSAVNTIASAFGGYHTCTKEQFVHGFNEVMKYEFHNEVFISEPVEIGTAFYDRNEKYFRQ
jgi:hypothetical protein